MTTSGHNPVAQTVTLQPILPAEPIVLCNASFLHTLSVVERDVAHLAITDAQSAQSAATLLQRLTTAGTVLENARIELKQPFIAKGREIDAAAKGPADRIEAAKRVVKNSQVAWAEEQARIARKAEAERQAELARLEAIRVAEERAAQEKAAALAKLAAQSRAKTKMAIEVADFDDEPPQKTETEKAIDRVKYAPAVVAAKPAGIVYKVTLVIDHVDPAKLVDVFVERVPKLAALRATFCTGWREGDAIPEVPGVAFRVQRDVASSGRSEF